MSLPARLFELLHAGLECPQVKRKRFWLDMGQAFSLRGLVLIPMRQGSERLLMVQTPDGKTLDVKPLRPTSWEPQEPYRIIPRAAELDASGRAARVLIEIQHTGEGRPCWETTDAMEGHHAKSNNEPKGI